jgi:hypothetical protein
MFELCLAFLKLKTAIDNQPQMFHDSLRLRKKFTGGKVRHGKIGTSSREPT